MPGFNENVRVPFYSLSDLVLDRHLYLYFENNEREEVNSICDFDSGNVSGDKSNDPEFRQEINDNSAELKIIDWREYFLVKMLLIYHKDN